MDFISNDTVTRVRGKNKFLYGACFFVIFESKHGHESTLYCSVFADFSVVQELTFSAFKRHQARQNPLGIRSIRGHVLIRIFHKSTLLIRETARKGKK